MKGSGCPIEARRPPHVVLVSSPLANSIRSMASCIYSSRLSTGTCTFGSGILILAHHAHVQHGQRLGTNFFGKQEIFVETEAVALVIIGRNGAELKLPAVDIQGRFSTGYGVLPLVTVGGFQYLQLCNRRENGAVRALCRPMLWRYLSQTVLVAIPRVDGKQRYMVNVDTSCGIFLKEHAQHTFDTDLPGTRLAVYLLQPALSTLILADATTIDSPFDAGSTSSTRIVARLWPWRP